MPHSPLVLSSRVPISERGGGPLGGTPAAHERALDFAVGSQDQLNWCWAAVSAAVARFYDPGTPWTQCRIANAELERNDCCAEGASGACNVPWSLRSALARVGHLGSWIPAPVPFGAIVSCIDDGNVLCARTEWAPGEAHFVVIFGYGHAGARELVVADPWNGTSRLPYHELRDRYLGVGTWTDSYFCR